MELVAVPQAKHALAVPSVPAARNTDTAVAPIPTAQVHVSPHSVPATLLQRSDQYPRAIFVQYLL